jgi:transglutaminase-like putative cysteine protease
LSTFFGKRNNGDSRPGDATGDGEISVPLYVAGGVVLLSALAVVAYQVSEPAFAYFTFILTVVGLFVSYHLRRIGTSPRLILVGTALLGLIFVYALRGAGVFGAILPLEIQGSQEILLISALAFTATFSSFLLLTDEAVVFSCVWAIAIIGLTGTININRELVICFAIFLAAATFLLIHQNTLAQAARARSAGEGGDGVAGDARRGWTFATERAATGNGPLERRRLLKAQLTTAGIAWLMAIVLGFLIAIPVQMVGRNLSLATIIQKLKVPPSATNRAASLPRLVFDDLNQFKVGLGPIDDDPTQRMTVLTDEPQYWRGRVYDQYLGRVWQSTLLEQAEELVSVPGGDTPEGFARFDLPRKGSERKRTVKQSHRFKVEGGIFGPIYHAAEPVQVRAPIARLNQRPDNTLGTGRGGGSEYEVDSEITRATPRDLQASGTRYPEEITARYLNQGTTNDAVRELMLEATSGVASNPYDRAQAIRRFISERAVYTRDARAVPRDRDAVEFFLNESKEGYCDLYATSMAMLCRYAGIPARVATGFAPGSPDPDWKPAGNEKRTRYILRGSDQHAWTEVYFNGYGWLPFDATVDTPLLTAPQQTPEPERQESAFEKWWRTGRFAVMFIALGVVGLLYVLYNEYFNKGPYAGVGGRVTDRGKAGQVIRLYFQTLRQVEKKAFRRESAQTPSEYVRRLRSDFDAPVADALNRLTRLSEGAMYGPHTVGDADVVAAKEAARQVGEALKEQRQRARDARGKAASAPASSGGGTTSGA